MAHSICGTLSPFAHRYRFLTRPPSLSLGVYFLSSRTRAFNHERNIVAIPHSSSALDGSREPRRDVGRTGEILNGTKSKGLLTIPFRIETLKRLKLQSHYRPCRPRRHDRPGISAFFVSLKTAFHRSTAIGTMRESTRFGVTCSESILTRRHATTTAFEAFTSLTLIPPRSRNQSSVRSLPVAGWFCKVKIITRVIRLGYIRGLFKAIGL